VVASDLKSLSFLTVTSLAFFSGIELPVILSGIICLFQSLLVFSRFTFIYFRVHMLVGRFYRILIKPDSMKFSFDWSVFYFRL
jgi:hypothetical protein